ncbi:MAG: sugar ABC transporter permease, partial [Chloroflexi bacterium]|nr:sugar ABC transporter permease [Chloroflexota bacterium]
MPSTNQAMTTAPSVKASTMTSTILAVTGAVVAFIGFFLPWLGFINSDGALVGSLTGVRIGASPVVELANGDVLFRGSMVAYLVPVVSVIILGLSLYSTFMRQRVAESDGFIKLGLSLITLLILWGQFARAQLVAERMDMEVQFQYGLIIVFLALLAMTVAGVLDIRTVMAQNPAFRNTLGALSFMSPATFLVIIFFLIPVVLMFTLSMTDLASKNFSDPWTFIGLENYRRMFSDTFFPKILGNTIFYVVMTLGFFNVGLALILALLTNHINRRASFFFRLMWLLPRITPSVVYIVMWQRFVQVPPYGIINQFLGWFGVEHQPYWLTEIPWVFVILVNGFVGASFGMIIFTSAIEAIPKDLITAAKVDGASAWQIIRDITLPMLRWPMLFVTSYQT